MRRNNAECFECLVRATTAELLNKIYDLMMSYGRLNVSEIVSAMRRVNEYIIFYKNVWT